MTYIHLDEENKGIVKSDQKGAAQSLDENLRIFRRNQCLFLLNLN